jgi:glyoxylase-like metal-dependent hydrolase (beta-lactamase superfamily II)
MAPIDRIHSFLWHSTTTNNCNTYLIEGPKPVLIDPGHMHLFDHVRRGLEALNLTVDDLGLVLGTHAHPDHLESVQLVKPTSALFAIHPDDWQLVQAMESQLAAMGLNLSEIAPDFFVTEGSLNVGALHLEVYHTPGHSPGSVCYYWPDARSLFAGDLIFKEGLGRTDLPGGSGTLLKKSIRRMAELELEYIFPGHGEVISGKDNVQKNFALLEELYFAYI